MSSTTVTNLSKAVKETCDCFNCMICKSQAKEPHMCVICTEIFCKQCVINWRSADGNNKCPKCSTSWAGGKLTSCAFVGRAIQIFAEFCRVINTDLAQLLQQPRVQPQQSVNRSNYWVDYLALEGNTLPANAFLAGYDDFKVKLYVCRVWTNRQVIIGKLNVNHQRCYFALDGKEQEFRQCQVLLNDPSFAWVAMTKSSTLPNNAIQGGRSSAGDPLYVGRATLGVGLGTSKHSCGMVDKNGTCTFSYSGKSRTSDDFEILVGNIDTRTDLMLENDKYYP